MFLEIAGGFGWVELECLASICPAVVLGRSCTNLNRECSQSAVGSNAHSDTSANLLWFVVGGRPMRGRFH